MGRENVTPPHISVHNTDEDMYYNPIDARRSFDRASLEITSKLVMMTRKCLN